MSHITKVGAKIGRKDLQFLKKACKAFNAQFVEGQTTFESYYGKNKCNHAIKVSGASYEIGVVQNGDHFELQMDNYSSGRLSDKVGNNAGDLLQRMSAEKAKHLAQRNEWSVRESLDEKTGDIVLTMTVM